EVDLRGGAITEVDRGDGVLAPQPGDIGIADGVRELTGDRNRDDSLPVAGDVPVSVRQAPPVGHEYLDREAAGDLDAMLPVGGEDEVVLAQSEGGPDLDRFLSLQHGIGADPTLPLESEHPAIEGAGQDHVAVEVLVQVRVESGILAHEVAGGIDHLDQWILGSVDDLTGISAHGVESAIPALDVWSTPWNATGLFSPRCLPTVPISPRSPPMSPGCRSRRSPAATASTQPGSSSWPRTRAPS